MTRANNASPFAPLALSPNDAAYLKELVQVFVGHQVQCYETYLHQDREHLDNTHWKLVLQRDHMRVFTELQEAKAPDDVDLESQQYPSDVPVMLVVGRMEGSLDDAMYGVMTPTVNSMRLKYFYAGDYLAKGAVLDTIERPSSANPFQSLTVKWVEGYQPRVIRSVVKNRDFVYMEATGFTKLSDGEVVGYQLIHSVHFPQTPEVRGNIRATISVCGLYRQRNHSAVEVFIRSSFNPAGSVARAIATKYYAVALVSARKLVQCAHLKKLAWLLRLRESDPNTAVLRGEAKCIGCGQKPGIFATDIGACSLCRQALCSSCRLKITLAFASPSGGLVKRKLWFCSYCVGEASRSSSRAVACEEYTQTRMHSTAWSSGPTMTSSRSSSSRDDDWSTMDSKCHRNLLP